MEIEKGKQYTVGVRFNYRGSPASFTNAPKWTIYNSNDQVVLSGAAQPNGNIWEATFTISKNYIVNGGKETLVLQFTGYDNRNASYTTDKELVISDLTDDFKPDGVFYNLITAEPIRDSIILPYENAKIAVAVTNQYDASPVASVIEYNSTATTANASGYVHNIVIPAFVVEKNIYLHPHQIIISYGENALTDMEIHPLYLIDGRALNYYTSMKLYLDKARLVEIDPSLQFHITELLQAILEGYRYINGSPPEGTFWNSTSMPSTLDNFLMYAALVYALNSRYLAEGFQRFDFTGLNTQLNYDRTPAIEYKISELLGFLEKLPDAKKSAILIGGKGETPPGETDRRLQSVAQLGISRNLLNNVPRRFTRPLFY